MGSELLIPTKVCSPASAYIWLCYETSNEIKTKFAVQGTEVVKSLFYWLKVVGASISVGPYRAGRDLRTRVSILVCWHTVGTICWTFPLVGVGDMTLPH